MMKETIKITNLNGMATIVGSFDQAVEADLFYGNNIKPQKLNTHKLVFNQTKGTPANVVSKYYQIIQHNEVMRAVTESLGEKGLDVSGIINNYGNFFQADLRFTNQGTPIKDDAQGLQIGMRVVNSYNKSTSFRLELFAYRLICNNGMALGSAMNNVKECVFHMGQEKTFEILKETVDTFIENVIESSSVLQNMINISREDNIKWDLVPEILNKYIKVKKHRSKIFEKLGIAVIEVEDTKTKKKSEQYILDNQENLLVNRWDLYNHVTDYASHTENLGFTVEKSLQDTAQKVLTKQFEELATVEV